MLNGHRTNQQGTLLIFHFLSSLFSSSHISYGRTFCKSNFYISLRLGKDIILHTITFSTKYKNHCLLQPNYTLSLVKKTLYVLFNPKHLFQPFLIFSDRSTPHPAHNKYALAIYLSRIFCLFFEVKNSSILDELNRMWYPVYKKNPEERGMSGNFQVQSQYFKIFCFFRFFIVFPPEM